MFIIDSYIVTTERTQIYSVVGGRQINKNEDIVEEIQNWYQETANNMQEQTMSLN